MRKSTRLIKAVASVVGVIIILAIILSKVIFSSDRLTALVLPKISQLLNRDVSAEQVELSFFPTIGIRITGLRVSNPDLGKYDSPYLLDAKAVMIDAKILPLLKNRLEINNVIFYSPVLYIEQNAKGKLNTDQLFSDSFYADGKNVRGSLSSLLLSNFEVSNGNIIWYNSKTGVSVKFLNVDFTSRIKTVVEEDKLLLNSQLRIGSLELWKDNSELFHGSTVDLAAKLDYDKRHDFVHIESDHASVFGIKVKTSVSLLFYPRSEVSIYAVNVDSSAQGVYNLLPAFLQNVIPEKSVQGKFALMFQYQRRGQSTSVDAQVRLTNFKAKLKSGDSLLVKDLSGSYKLKDGSSELDVSVPRVVLGDNVASFKFGLVPPKFATAKVLVDLNLKKLAHSLQIPDIDRFSGTIQAKYDFNYSPSINSVRADGLVTFDNALVQLPIGIDTLYTGEFNGRVSIVNNRASFKNLLVRLGASDMVLTGAFTNYQGILLGDKGLMPSLRINVLSKTFSTIGLLPHLNLNLGRQSLAWLPSANVALDFNIAKCILPTDTLTKVTGNLKLLDYFVKLNKLSYTSSAGSFLVSGWTDYSQEGRTTFSIKTRIATNNFGRLADRYLGKVDIVGGSGSGTLALNGVYDDSGKVDLATLGGRGQLKIKGASVRHYSVLDRLYDFLGDSGKDSVEVSNASLSVDITDGRVYFNKLIAYGTPFDFRLEGWHGFDGTLDYKLALMVYPPMSLRIMNHLRSSYPDLSLGQKGTLALGLVAGGTTSDARFTIVSFNATIAENHDHVSNELFSLK
ncbi:MAG: AsmA family protein [Bacteroidetes bacterium]|nr:AsmA family protein [Bacteroidota bacterium]